VIAGSQAPVEVLIEEYGLPVLDARGEPVPCAGVEELTRAVAAAEAEGRGPCRIETTGLTTEEELRITARYLESHPAAALHWRAEGLSPMRRPLRITLGEPYVGGLNSPAGLAVDPARRTTLTGLYAAGETAGGTPGKGIVGVFAEALMAAETAAGDLEHLERGGIDEEEALRESRRINGPLIRLSRVGEGIDPHAFERRLQRVMETYAGPPSRGGEPEGDLLKQARRELQKLAEQVPYLACSSNHDAVLCLRAQDRLLVARALVEHLLAHNEGRDRPILSRLDAKTGEPTTN
jgi:adenylylsulfate reductase subunit A